MGVYEFRQLIELTLDESDDPQLEALIESFGVRTTALIVSAAFAYAVQKRFPSDTTLEALRDYVQWARSRLAPGEEAPQIYVEALVRSVLKDEDVMREVPRNQVLPIQTWMLHVLVNDAFPGPEGRRRFAEEAAAYAQVWLNEANIK
jgi:hypothetical protein